MADKLTPGSDDGDGRVSKQHNIAARQDVINKAYTQFRRLNLEERDAIEEHVKPTRDARTKLMRELKADTGIPIAVFKAQFKLQEMAEEAELNEESDNAATIDDMRVVFFALRKGGQLDFTAVVDGSDSRGGDVVDIGSAEARG